MIRQRAGSAYGFPANRSAGTGKPMQSYLGKGVFAVFSVRRRYPDRACGQGVSRYGGTCEAGYRDSHIGTRSGKSS